MTVDRQGIEEKRDGQHGAGARVEAERDLRPAAPHDGASLGLDLAQNAFGDEVG